jgi:hypothetical protein
MRYFTLLTCAALLLAITTNTSLAAWSAAPLEISITASNRNSPRITRVADGYIILWEDDRSSTTTDIYGQKLSFSGDMQWTVNGALLNSGRTTGSKNLQLAAGVDANVYFSWTDTDPAGSFDVGTVVRLDRTAVYTGEDNNWQEGGIKLPTSDRGGNSSLCSDGEGGIFSSYTHYIGSIGPKKHTLVSRMASNGTVTPYGYIVANNIEADCSDLNVTCEPSYAGQLVSSGQGEAIIAWKNMDFPATELNYSLKAQKLTAISADNAGRAWGIAGIHLSTQHPTSDQIVQSFDITSDGAGGLLAAWIDSRNGNPDLFGQWVDTNGTVGWTANGLTINSITATQDSPKVSADGSGGAVFVWEDNRTGSNQIYGQRVNTAGETLWQADGIDLGSAGGSTMARIMRVQTSNFIVTWLDDNSNSIMAQKINSDGDAMWPNAGVSIAANLPAPVDAYDMLFDQDRQLLIVTWATEGNIFAQQLALNGTHDPDSPVLILTEKITPAVTGKPYSFRLEAAGGNGEQISWSLDSGSLPPGMKLDGEGYLSGSPEYSGLFTFTVTARAGTSATKTYTISAVLETALTSTNSASTVETPNGILLFAVENSATISALKLDYLGNPVGDKTTVITVTPETLAPQVLALAYNPLTSRILLLFRSTASTDGKQYLYGTFLDQDGTPLSDAINLAPFEGDYIAAAVAVIDNQSSPSYGVFFVAYTEKIVVDVNIDALTYGRFLDENGAFSGEPFVINDGKARHGIVIDTKYNQDTDNFLLLYRQKGGRNLYSKTIQLDGTVSDSNDTQPSIAVNTEDELDELGLPTDTSRKPQAIFVPALQKHLIAWNDHGTDVESSRTKGLFLDQDGIPVGTAFSLSQTDSIQSDPYISSRGQAVFWSDDRDGVDNGYDIYAQLIGGPGPLQAEDSTVISMDGDQRYPVAAYVGGGHFMVFWNTDGKIYGILHELPITIPHDDINGDFVIDISDAIGGLQVLSNSKLSRFTNHEADISGDKVIGLDDIIYVLQKIAELRE